MGKMSRTKGADFERLICSTIRAAAPMAIVRRGKQSHNADEGDVVVELEGSRLNRLWIECNHSSKESISGKLLQAEGDCRRSGRQVAHGDMIPIVVWRRTGSRTINVTLRFGALLAIRADSSEVSQYTGDGAEITIKVEDFLEVVLHG